MKKIVASALLISGLFLGAQVMGQSSKTDATKQSSSSKTETRSENSNTSDTKSVTTSSSAVQTKTSSYTTKPPQAENKVNKQPVSSANKAQAIEGQKILDPQGRTSAIVQKDGTIRDKEGRVMGRVSNKGEYFNAAGDKVGSFEAGIIRTAEGKEFAKISENGRVYNAAGKYMGTIADDGTVLNSRGIRLGEAVGIEKSVAALVFFFPKQTPLPDNNTLKMKN